MKNVLILLDYYKENMSANGVCCENVVYELLDRGYKVFIGCYRTENTLDIEEADGIHILKTSTIINENKHTKVQKILTYLKWLIPFYKYPLFQDPKRTKEIASRVCFYVEQFQIDTLVCINYPIENLIAGLKVKEYNPKIELIAYMLDPLSAGINPRFLPSVLCIARKRRWETRIFKKYDRIILMESSRSHYQKYPLLKKIQKKAVFSDIPLMANKELSFSKIPESKTIRICYAGTMGEGIRTPYAFLKMMKFIKNLSVEILFVGKNLCKREIKEFATDNITIKELGCLEHKETLDLIKEADFLLNLGNVQTTLVPSKIFEYMSFGKPIISTYLYEDDSSLPYLSKYPNLHLFDEKSTDLEYQAKCMREFLESARGRRIEYSDIVGLYYNNTPECFCNILESGMKVE